MKIYAFILDYEHLLNPKIGDYSMLQSSYANSSLSISYMVKLLSFQSLPSLP